MKWSEKLVVAKLSLACLLSTAMVIGGSNALASSTWSGAAGDGDWNNPANWSGGKLDVVTGVVTPDDLVVPNSVTAAANIGGRPDRGDADPTNMWPASSGPHNSPPVINAATGLVVLEDFDINAGNESYDGIEGLITIDGGRVHVGGDGKNSALTMGRSPSQTLPVGSVPKSRLVIQGGGEVFVGSFLHSAINGGLIPSPAAGAQIRLGQTNIVIDGPGSKLVVSDQLRYVGGTSVGKNPLPGSGIIVSDGGYLETGNLRLESINGLDGLDLMAGVIAGSNAGFLDIIGPDSSVKVFGAFAGGGTTLLEKLQYLVNVDGVIVADGGDPLMRVSIADLGGGDSYLLTSVAIPEPSSIVLLGMVIAGFAGCGTRRRR